jgi:hypothetical protein
MRFFGAQVLVLQQEFLVDQTAHVGKGALMCLRSSSIFIIEDRDL